MTVEELDAQIKEARRVLNRLRYQKHLATSTHEERSTLAKAFAKRKGSDYFREIQKKSTASKLAKKQQRPTYTITSSAVHLVSDKPCAFRSMIVHSGEGEMRLYNNKAASKLVAVIPLRPGIQELNLRFATALTIDTSQATNVHIDVYAE